MASVQIVVYIYSYLTELTERHIFYTLQATNTDQGSRMRYAVVYDVIDNKPIRKAQILPALEEQVCENVNVNTVQSFQYAFMLICSMSLCMYLCILLDISLKLQLLFSGLQLCTQLVTYPT